MPEASYHLSHPANRSTSVIFASPHSGRDYDWAFLRRTLLDSRTIRSSEDAFVDRLFDSAPSHGALFLKAGAPRAFIDLNRNCDELDPALIEGIANRRSNPRIATGLGVIPRVVANGRSIYHGKISLTEAQERIDQFWRPYHATLGRLMKENHNRFGEAILIDCHSMPREAVANLERTSAGRPDIVLGDRFGTAASSLVVDQIEAIFAEHGFRVSRNSPFAGAFVVQHYGRPARGLHAVQVEIDRSLYMDEAKIVPSDDFMTVRSLMRRIVAKIAEIGRQSSALAAE